MLLNDLMYKHTSTQVGYNILVLNISSNIDINVYRCVLKQKKKIQI